MRNSNSSTFGVINLTLVFVRLNRDVYAICIHDNVRIMQIYWLVELSFHSNSNLIGLLNETFHFRELKERKKERKGMEAVKSQGLLPATIYPGTSSVIYSVYPSLYLLSKQRRGPITIN